jgi:hypothetical protein
MVEQIPAGHVEQHSSERAKQLIVVLIFAALVFAAAFYIIGTRFSQISSTQTEVSEISGPAIENIPEETPPSVSEIEKIKPIGEVSISTLPPELERSHFGFVNAKQNYKEIHDFGVSWDRAFPGPFNWNSIGYKDFNFDATDRYARQAEDAGFAILAVVWPYNDLDQQECRSSYPALDFRKYSEIATRTGLPCSEDDYSRFITALVERYDGDGVKDMPDLRYPIKYWEFASTPEVQDRAKGELYFTGDGIDYANFLTTTYNIIKAADPDAKVLHGSVFDTDSRSTSFWTHVYGAQPKFDIAAVQCTQSCDDELKNIITKYNSKPVWVTAVSYSGDDDTQAKDLFKGHITALGKGAQKIFYDKWRITGGGKAELAALNTQTDKRKSYFALKTVIDKVGTFTSVEKITGGYKFQRANDKKQPNTYAFLSAGELPKELQGTIAITDYNGTTKTRQGAFNLFAGEVPSFVEAVG